MSKWSEFLAWVRQNEQIGDTVEIQEIVWQSPGEHTMRLTIPLPPRE